VGSSRGGEKWQREVEGDEGKKKKKESIWRIRQFNRVERKASGDRRRHLGSREILRKKEIQSGRTGDEVDGENSWSRRTVYFKETFAPAVKPSMR